MVRRYRWGPEYSYKLKEEEPGFWDLVYLQLVWSLLPGLEAPLLDLLVLIGWQRWMLIGLC